MLLPLHRRSPRPTGEHVTFGIVEGYEDVGVPEELLEQLRMHTLAEQQTEEAA